MEPVRVDYTNEALQRDERQHEDWYLAGEHGQETSELTGGALHPFQGVLVEEMTELDVVKADDEEVNWHEKIRSCVWK